MPVRTLVPTAVVSAGGWAANGAATLYECVDDPFGSHDGDTTYISGPEITPVRLSLGNMPDLISVQEVTLRWIARGDAGGVGQTVNVGIRTGAVPTDYSAGAQPVDGVGGAYLEYTNTWLVNPNTSAPWTKAELDALEVWAVFDDVSGAVDSFTITSILVNVTYVAASALLGGARDAGSRWLWTRNRPLPKIVAWLPAWACDREVFEAATWSHPAGPRTADEGWTNADDERGYGINVEQETDLDHPVWRTRVVDVDARHFWTLDWDPMISTERPGITRPGIPSINAGAGRLFDRASKKWVYSAAAAEQGITQLVEVPSDVEGCAALGTLIEGEAINRQLHSSFVSGVSTGWTPTGTGSNGSAIAVETGIVLFDTAITPNSAKITSGNPIHAADLYLLSTNAVAVLNTEVWVASFDHYDASTDPLYYAIEHSVSGWWRDSDQTWQGAIVWNAMTASSGAWHRHVTKLMTMAANGNLTVRVGVPTASGVAGQINYLAHVQVERTRWASSQIPTTTAAVTRVLDDLRLENFTGARVWPESQGTTLIWIRPSWNSADIASNKALLLAYIDASNLEYLLYAQASASFVFRRRVAGVTQSATLATAVTRGSLYKLAVRRTGVKAELGLPAYTLDIFVNGVKGTSGQGVAMAAYGASPELFIGQDEANTFHCEGYLQQRLSTPIPLTDDELIAATT